MCTGITQLLCFSRPTGVCKKLLRCLAHTRRTPARRCGLRLSRPRSVVERVSRARSPARHDRRHLKPRASPRSRLAQPRHSAPSLMAADALPSAQAHELVRPSERRIGSGRMSEAVSGDGHHRSARDVPRSWSRCWRGQPTHRASAISAFCDHIGTKASLLCSRAARRQTRSNGARRRGWTRRRRAHARLRNQPSQAPAMGASPRRRKATIWARCWSRAFHTPRRSFK